MKYKSMEETCLSYVDDLQDSYRSYIYRVFRIFTIMGKIHSQINLVNFFIKKMAFGIRF